MELLEGENRCARRNRAVGTHDGEGPAMRKSTSYLRVTTADFDCSSPANPVRQRSLAANANTEQPRASNRLAINWRRSPNLLESELFGHATGHLQERGAKKGSSSWQTKGQTSSTSWRVAPLLRANSEGFAESEFGASVVSVQ